MGLDIKAYSRIELLESYDDAMSIPDKHRDNAYLLCASVLEGTENQASGIKDGEVYTSEALYSFRAGSYPGFKAFRNNLRNLSENAPYDFDEFLDFPDCEGVFGPDACKRLYEVFKMYYPKACEYNEEQSYEDFLDVYEEFMMAFRLATKNGAVEFH